MSKAPHRKVYGKTQGRLIVSEGIAPSTNLFANDGLPTVGFDTVDDRFEIVIPKGTILSLVEGGNGDSTVVPANGTGTARSANDGQGTGGDSVTIPSYSVPIGIAQQDAYRTFDRNTSVPVSWIREAYVEWPMVEGLNDDIKPGDLVSADNIGRPVKCDLADVADQPWIVIGRVIEVGTFASNFDRGMLDYMQIPSGEDALNAVYSITKPGGSQGLRGIPANLDVADAVGAFRVALNV